MALTVALLLLTVPSSAYAGRRETVLREGWRFHLGEVPGAEETVFDDASWERVRVPHDWAVKGPFDRENDLQRVAVAQNYERESSLKTGRTGGLPYVGIGWYRCHFAAGDGAVTLLFDGAMSGARVWVNGEEVGEWPYGYNAFHFDISPYVVSGGDNVLAVRLENLPNSSRWYPGAGLFRKVRLIETGRARIPVWGVRILTPSVDSLQATVEVNTSIENPGGLDLVLETRLLGPDGQAVTAPLRQTVSGGEAYTVVAVPGPSLWSPETPSLYRAEHKILQGDVVLDSCCTVFGIRRVEFRPHDGFYLNGERRKFKGVCNHHDLGPLGAAVNASAIRHRLTLLKDMGCDAIRTTHNMPSEELVSLCDEMGFMLMVEPFDEWDVAKCRNGYHRLFRDWAEKDMVNMLHHFRNNPSVVLWSIGNEVPTQCRAEGWKVAAFLQEICHREDPSRLVTCGMDRVDCVLDNGFASVLDVPGINYRTFRYEEAYGRLPQGFVLGSETASTVSSRGVYKFPAEKRFSAKDLDRQCSAYDLDACSWSNIPDIDFALAEDYPWTLGQFVWTGFDYLGEPSPYDTDSWPSHSSMFGIIDLASIPKDRYWLYRSVWNTSEHTLHILPHWNWKKGDRVPVFVYTDSPSAELFVNGVSIGRRTKSAPAEKTRGLQDEDLESRYRLIWEDVPFRPGTLKAVALDENGRKVSVSRVRTARKPYKIQLECSRSQLSANGEDLAYITVSVVDRRGNLCPEDSRWLDFSVSGSGCFEASANGDPTCLDPLQEPGMHLFCGKLGLIVRSGDTPGNLVVEVSGKGLRSASVKIPVL